MGSKVTNEHAGERYLELYLSCPRRKVEELRGRGRGRGTRPSEDGGNEERTSMSTEISGKRTKHVQHQCLV